MFTRNFEKFACIGDTISCEVDRFTIIATLVNDDTNKPEDSECYTETQVKAFYNNEWEYCGVVLSVEFKGHILDKHASSLWAIEVNFPESDNSYLLEVANELLPEALENAKAILKNLRED